MDSSVLSSVSQGRSSNYADIMRTSLWAQVAIAGIIGAGAGDAAGVALAVLTIGIALYGVLAGDAALKDLSNLMQDMPDDMKATAYGRAAQTNPFMAYRAISAVVHIVVALAILLALF
ncbi:MAG: hypothetical protein ACE5FS_08465 [Paracoccaceae bacterium]